MKRYKQCECGCGKWAKSLVEVTFVPEQLRSAYVASEDVEHLAVAKACADRMIALNGSWCGLV
jgi:hypothetical protein